MAQGSVLTAQQVQAAVEYNRTRVPAGLQALLRAAFGPGAAVLANEAFVRLVADWQEANIGPGAGDGKIGPRTEAHLNIAHPKAIAAAVAAQKVQAAGSILFDSWGNDLRDNNLDGAVDGKSERSADGAHFGKTYTEFRTVAGTYSGGWDFLPARTVIVRSSRTIKGSFIYRVCADIVSGAYAAAGVMQAKRATWAIHAEFQKRGFVWRRSESYPSEYLPGDFICTLEGGEGHSGIVVQREPTRGGDVAPVVVQLPGPSTQISDGTYDPTRTNDVTIGRWSDWRITRLPKDVQYLGRLLLSKTSV
jgi:hypothetical protein